MPLISLDALFFAVFGTTVWETYKTWFHNLELQASNAQLVATTEQAVQRLSAFQDSLYHARRLVSINGKTASVALYDFGPVSGVWLPDVIVFDTKYLVPFMLLLMVLVVGIYQLGRHSGTYVFKAPINITNNMPNSTHVYNPAGNSRLVIERPPSAQETPRLPPTQERASSPEPSDSEDISYAHTTDAPIDEQSKQTAEAPESKDMADTLSDQTPAPTDDDQFSGPDSSPTPSVNTAQGPTKSFTQPPTGLETSNNGETRSQSLIKAATAKTNPPTADARTTGTHPTASAQPHQPLKAPAHHREATILSTETDFETMMSKHDYNPPPKSQHRQFTSLRPAERRIRMKEKRQQAQAAQQQQPQQGQGMRQERGESSLAAQQQAARQEMLKASAWAADS